jgi:hypothetical protein
MVQYLRVVYGSRDKAGMFDGILYHFSRCLVEDNVNHLHANTFHQMKMILHAKEN